LKLASLFTRPTATTTPSARVVDKVADFSIKDVKIVVLLDFQIGHVNIRLDEPDRFNWFQALGCLKQHSGL
jgi:hypothetical protein